MPLSIVILAAGQGTRMRSRLPKVLQTLAGRPLLAHVLDAADKLSGDAVYVVYGHGGEQVPEAFADRDIEWVRQESQLGTGHAVAQTIGRIPDSHLVMVLYGDVPLIRAETLQRLIDAAVDGDLVLLTTKLDDPSGYGRILRDTQGGVTRIVEHKDATDTERRINEINTGLLLCSARRLRAWLNALGNDNAQGEYYLTDIIGMAASEGLRVEGLVVEEADEVHGINDRAQLAEAERLLRERNAERLLRDGVTLADPARIDIRGKLQCGQDVSIDVNVVFEGDVTLGDNVRIGPGCVIRDCTIGEGSVINALCHLEAANVGRNCRIGPYARLRPGAMLSDDAHVGNFVEIKKSDIGRGSKVNHLTYIGDASIGAGVNIGAGTITCNYDGANKHRTVIEDGAFIGSNTALVAPVRVGRNATVGAGSTISKDAPADALTVSRARQASIDGWQRPKKK
ncbi:MAG TPA: bifunctional UDP-N-acetylglucosamine diphosphorylase/glucosamine-1-phosphate N-acetyltransferase GlmU [Gammaproteobacteria bacterium]